MAGRESACSFYREGWGRAPWRNQRKELSQGAVCSLVLPELQLLGLTFSSAGYWVSSVQQMLCSVARGTKSRHSLLRESQEVNILGESWVT